MPGRTSTRSARASNTGPARKSSTTTLKSARTSVVVPDEGPENSLRTQICQIFSDAQNTTATQRKLQINLRKLQERCCFEPQETKKNKKAQLEEDFDEADFNNEMIRCVLRVLGVKKGEPVGDRIIRFLGLFLKHATEKDQALFQAEDEDEEAAFRETPSSRLTSQILTTLLEFLTAKDKVVRFRATQAVAHIVNSLETIDDEIFNLIRLGFLKRLRDKEPYVRVQAVLGLGRLAENDDVENDDEDSEDDVAGGILEKLIDVMMNDPSADVRRAVLQNLPFTLDTIKFLLERARDMDASMRRIVYGRILPTLGDFRHMLITEREKLIRWGLRDRDDLVRKSAARLFSERWLEDCAGSHDTRLAEEKKPGEPAPLNMEALTELLERIDITRSGVEEGIAHDAMRQFWELRPDYREFVTFDHDFWYELDSSQAFVARSLNDYCNNVEDDRLREMLEDKLPEVQTFAFIVQKHLNTLMELVARFAVMEDDDPEYKEVQEDADEQEFVVEQLLHIALTLDYSDEVGRRQMYNIMRSALSRAQLPEECTELAVRVLRTCCGTRGEADFCAVILEAIAEVRDTLMEDDVTERGDDAEESFHSARSDISDGERSTIEVVPRKAKPPKQLSPEEEEEKRIREVMVFAKCLHIAQCTLQNVERDLESDTSLTSILNTLIIPAVRAQEAMIRERGVVCLGLCTILSKDLAIRNLDLFFHCFNKGHDALKEIVIQTLADVVITYPSLLAPLEPDPDATSEDAEPAPNPLVEPLTKVLTRGFNSEDKSVSLMACTAASKLLLLGILPPLATAKILKVFTLTYFNPETSANPALGQALSYFIPVFCHSKLKNALLMAHISVPIMTKLLSMREDIDDDQVSDMVSWPTITAHLSEWTDGRKVVGATELGLDGKTSTAQEAEEPHIVLASEILERAGGDTKCSKDERKPLLMLLTKLFIASSGPLPDEEVLRKLHEQVTKAVKGGLGMDATQRNYLSKLELGLTKRLGEVEHVTQVVEVEDETVTPEVTEGPGKQQVEAADEEEEEEQEEEDTMLANLQGEGTRMPLEEEMDEDGDGDVTMREAGRSVSVSESDIMEDLLASEMEG
ncbi:hypothetical protein K458DRAFT_365340 [Lentithecium fluviatile CBS 122367]|uniref:Nuclear condensin complex subunit 3 C-terminal domain-containing protein n=1 Tax=Lentithecium fluviatile CBS 122367 TaxID=1168545 RepID=A0A6G1J3L9_9PLEO|nr:hypothetical protein K458DRAFT_365340 [Lentithecium fluviatile CBS 122367]